MKFGLFLTSLLLVAAPLASARTIQWGNAIFDTNLDSAGFALNSSYTVEIGTFGNLDLSITPVENWGAAWKLLDTSIYDTSDSVIPGLPNNHFAGEVILKDNNTFAVGEQVYIWIYNSKTPVEGSQWAIFTNKAGATTTDDWTIPTAPGNQTDFPTQMFVSGANNVPFGGVNNVQGPGEHTSNPPSFKIQTHTFVPEGESALLIGLGGFLLMMRRRRK